VRLLSQRPVPLLVEESLPGRRGVRLPVGPQTARPQLPPGLQRRTSPKLPELTENQVVRHYTRLSQLNYGLDTGMIPLGSCTMKYNPRLCDEVAGWPEAAHLHPDQHPATIQGALRVMHELEEWLKEITGMDAVSLHGAAGSHGEFLGLLLVRAYHESRGEGAARTKVIVPDTAHGTNPASAAMAGYEVVEIPSTKDGTVDLEALQAAVGADTACLMLTNPNTLGIFEDQIQAIQKTVHDAGGLLYYDGANLNAILGIARPGDMGFDICHVNLHKTFAVPHGAGGPGGGPVGVKARLAPFLPVPRIRKAQTSYHLDYNAPQSIGKVREFYGNFVVHVRAYSYMLLLGGDGLKHAAEMAVLNANYLKQRLIGTYTMPFKSLRKHEFVLSATDLKRKRGIRALDIAKRLLDHGFYAPTVYFPHLVDEALMIEPTETESREELDAFAEALLAVAQEDPALVTSAPHETPVARIDDVWAAKNLVLTWRELHKLKSAPPPPTPEKALERPIGV
jgi:glycine cleavage system P protein (glycine dehydrogenase) subunit 2